MYSFYPNENITELKVDTDNKFFVYILFAISKSPQKKCLMQHY